MHVSGSSSLCLRSSEPVVFARSAISCRTAEGDFDGSLEICASRFRHIALIFYCESSRQNYSIKPGKWFYVNRKRDSGEEPETYHGVSHAKDESFHWRCSIRMRPRPVFLFHKVAKAVPGEFPVRYWTTESDFAVGDTNYFPISMARTVFDVNFLSYLKRVGFEDNNGVIFVVHDGCSPLFLLKAATLSRVCLRALSRQGIIIIEREKAVRKGHMYKNCFYSLNSLCILKMESAIIANRSKSISATDRRWISVTVSAWIVLPNCIRSSIPKTPSPEEKSKMQRGLAMTAGALS